MLLKRFSIVLMAITIASVSAVSSFAAEEKDLSRDSIESLANSFCDSWMQKEFDVFFSLPHPDMLAEYLKLLQVNEPEMTLESLSEAMNTQTSEMQLESCKVLDSQMFECEGDMSGYVSPMTDGMSMEYEECGSATIELTVKDYGSNAQEAGFVKIDGKWYMDLAREIFEEMSIGGAQNFYEYAHYFCDNLYASGEYAMTEQFLPDFMALALIKAGESDDDETAFEYIQGIISDVFGTSDNINHCSVTQREVVDCADVMVEVGSKGLELFVPDGISAESAQASADDMDVSYCGTMRLDYETDTGKEVAGDVVVGYYGMWGIIGYSPLD